MRRVSLFLAFGLSIFVLHGCGKGPQNEETCTSSGCTERSINQPVSPPPGTLPEDEEPIPPAPPGGYRLPAFNPAWGLTRSVYEKAARRQAQARKEPVGNPHYFIVVDFNLHSSKRRMFIFDLRRGVLERHLTTHGSGSDPNRTGYARFFSNTDESKRSSLGLYLTSSIYYGKHGRSLRLEGLDASNSNAESRSIVIHPANYVNEPLGRAGNSWGCVALDPHVAGSVISRVRGGALLLIDR